jgi:hypothetical protein
MHLTFSKLDLPGSKTKKVVIDRKSTDTKQTEYQLQLEFKTSKS